MYANNQEIEYSKLSDPLTSFNDESKVGANVVINKWDDFSTRHDGQALVATNMHAVLSFVL